MTCRGDVDVEVGVVTTVEQVCGAGISIRQGVDQGVRDRACDGGRRTAVMRMTQCQLELSEQCEGDVGRELHVQARVLVNGV